ncbi:N-acetyltransferase 8-like 2 [Cynoglossus semilaevis]|uniref:N-acetyltransferase 8-like 2 n=1 Tax=Cynoglossus semilaevis TaxID=244447 RepID=UPI0004952400|nr:N-acetyltransferase family 8 member 7-like [Cynoglossus semilaevis]XP_024915536.1 N-acetyltransferase family 8 member 7-like [Cynoglossus semilaevis]XP_024915537.1 N-acetyltransferase family 8 member 7-like [Cynoglossus semilaevis]
MKLLVRPYRPVDRDAVRALFSWGIREHIVPCFKNNMSSPLYLVITLALCVVGYIVASVFGAVVLPALWMSLVYYSGYYIYDGFVRRKLVTDMQEISRNYMSRPDDCLWVAEAEVDGRVQILGMVAVKGQQNGKEKCGELLRMIVSPTCRRMGLGHRLAQTVVDFCRERGFSKVMLETSSIQKAAVALYKKMGFRHIVFQSKHDFPLWIVALSNVKVLKLEKQL